VGYEGDIGDAPDADDPRDAAIYDQEYFKEILATVQVRPEDAVDEAPSASP